MVWSRGVPLALIALLLAAGTVPTVASAVATAPAVRGLPAADPGVQAVELAGAAAAKQPPPKAADWSAAPPSFTAPVQQAAFRHEPVVLGGAPVPSPVAPRYLVRLVSPDEPFGFCGGTLASALVVVTAAHCVTDDLGDAMDPADLNVLAGTSVRGAGGRRVAVVDVVVHPDYDPVTVDSDLAVLLLAKAQPGPYARFAAASPAAGSDVLAYGWGLNERGSSPLRLFGAALDVVGGAACDTAMTGINDVTPQMLCAGATGRGVCSGDSGGPLFTGAFPNLVQVGVASWVVKDVEDNCLTLSHGFPSVFADVASMQDFLEPFLLATAGFQLDFKQPWVLDGFLAVEQGDDLEDLCAFVLATGSPELECLGGTPAAVLGRTPILLLPALPSGLSYTFTAQAFDSMTDADLSPVVTAVAAGRAQGLTKVVLDLKPLVPIVQVKPELVYSFVLMENPITGDQCQFLMWTSADALCDGDLVPLAGNHVAFLGDLPLTLGFLGGGYQDGSTPFTVTKVTTVVPALKPGLVALGPKFVLSDGVGGLDLKGAKATAWSATLWVAGDSSETASCVMFTLPQYNSADCEGPATIGLRGGKVALDLGGPVAAIDVEAIQLVGTTFTGAVSENVLLTQNLVVARSLRFGPVALA